jgi:asparagine synthase (glutamine-hydrolysing)
MCGIAVSLHLDGRPVSEFLLMRLTEALSHRGPDGQGLFIDDGRFMTWADGTNQRHTIKHPWPAAPGCPTVGLGHRRLAILDLSDAGQQPMSDPSRRYWITYNGEVYNYLELRSQLAQSGYEFRTRTDTEVVLGAFIQQGAQALERFNGMWAFAIWDAKERALFVSRDRYGIKPLYRFDNGRSIHLASELKAFVRSGLCDPGDLDHDAVGEYLVEGLTDHRETTVIRGVRHVPPACWQLANGSGTKGERYYHHPLLKKPVTTEKSESRASSTVRDLLFDSVRLRLRSDVAVGSSLSGGLDSTAILCLVSRILRNGGTKPPEDLLAFTVGHAEPSCDERRWARLATRWTGATAVEYVPTQEELWKDWRRTAYHQDEPFGSASIFSQWVLMKSVREKKIKVLLDGQGADELFAGYNLYPLILLAEKMRKGKYLSAIQHLHTIGKGKALLSLWLALKFNLPTGIRALGGARRSSGRLSWVRDGWRDTWARKSADLHRQRRGTLVALNARLAEDHFAYNLRSLLRYEDRNAMAFSIETRLPFLDFRLVDYALSLGAELNIKAGRRKNILRKAVSGLIPPEIENRADKMGFTTPERSWLRQLGPQVREMLMTSRCASEYVDTQAMAASVDARLQKSAGKTGALWRVLCLDVWAQAMSDARRGSSISS